MQYDAFDLGIITTDEFTNAEILEATYPTVRERLLKDLEREADKGIPICVVTGFLGKVSCKHLLDIFYYALIFSR
jgi:aspartate kinase